MDESEVRKRYTEIPAGSGVKSLEFTPVDDCAVSDDGLHGVSQDGTSSVEMFGPGVPPLLVELSCCLFCGVPLLQVSEVSAPVPALALQVGRIKPAVG